MGFYEAKEKFTVTVISTGNGTPLRYVGSYFHCMTALSASGISKGWPCTARAFTTSPFSLMTASMSTSP